jgi:hypothetical protein
MPIYPISFSIPERYIVNEVPKKTKNFATIVPGNVSTYVFSTQDEYYADYQTSLFGITHKKAGWDCMRHYEILANGCIPWMTDLDDCPKSTMTHFPKDLVKEAMGSKNPESYIPKLLDYTRKHLTTKAMAQYIFTTLNVPNPNRVLFLSGDAYPDYQRCLTLTGMKELLGKNCVDDISVPHIYDDYGDVSKLYGKGFSYTKIVPAEFKTPEISGKFDFIIYGSVHRGMPYWENINNMYDPSQIILICGADSCHHDYCFAKMYANRGYQCFVRELNI